MTLSEQVTLIIERAAAGRYPCCGAYTPGEHGFLVRNDMCSRARFWAGSAVVHLNAIEGRTAAEDAWATYIEAADGRKA